MIADLHLHTMASDGKLTPTELVHWANQSGIEVMAITDHDTVDGLYEGEQAAKKEGISFVKGIEISSQSYCEVHVLGYGMDVDNETFRKELETIKSMRKERNIGIGKKLEELGIRLDMDFEAKGVGRMNIARAMIKQGYVKDADEAFDKYLKMGAKAYCPSKRITPQQAVEVIVNAGGFASLAHPKKYLLDKRLEKMLKELVPCGLKGLEVNYPSHYESDKDALRKLCHDFKLLPTGGSDYHGEDDKRFTYHLDMRVIDTLRIPKN